jgi:hypothetical protein
MPLLTPARSAQYPLMAEITFNFNDSFVDTNNNVTPLSAFDANARVFDIIPLPPGATVIGGELIVDTLFAGGTLQTLSLGDSASATRYASGVTLKTAGRTALTLTGFVGNGENIRASYTNTVAAATAGKVTVRILYTLANRSQEVVIR